jgi:hypothetical protein
MRNRYSPVRYTSTFGANRARHPPKYFDHHPVGTQSFLSIEFAFYVRDYLVLTTPVLEI